jgi:hypothetical protein
MGWNIESMFLIFKLGFELGIARQKSRTHDLSGAPAAGRK